MLRSRCRIGVLLLGLIVSLAACGDECGEYKVPTKKLHSGTYKTGTYATLVFPGGGIDQKTMVYDEQTNKMTITYTYNNKRYVETWTVASSSALE